MTNAPMWDALAKVVARFEELDRQLSDPAVAADPRRLRDLARERSQTEPTIRALAEHRRLEKTVRKYFEKLLNLHITDFGKIDPAVAQRLADPDMKREELRELMKSIAYPEGWFYVERAAVIMFGLQATLAPKLNGIHVGFPYITQFIFERNAKDPTHTTWASTSTSVDATGYAGKRIRFTAPVRTEAVTMNMRLTNIRDSRAAGASVVAGASEDLRRWRQP